jgi:hypothetical protein
MEFGLLMSCMPDVSRNAATSPDLLQMNAMQPSLLVT